MDIKIRLIIIYVIAIIQTITIALSQVHNFSELIGFLVMIISITYVVFHKQTEKTLK